MRKFVVLSLLTIGLVACQDESLDVGIPQEMKSSEGVVYPMQSMSRNVSSLDTDWENMTNIQLSANENIYFPWANNGSDSNMPYSFVMDIKKEDGWKMLFHSFTPEAESNIRYMALYNQRTGFLKVFHYLPTNVFL